MITTMWLIAPGAGVGGVVGLTLGAIVGGADWPPLGTELPDPPPQAPSAITLKQTKANWNANPLHRDSTNSARSVSTGGFPGPASQANIPFS
jgi:hypothetical protein